MKIFLCRFYNKVPLNIIAAIVKYMINPVTSTKVATNGAEEAAGSSLSFFKNIGIIAPFSVPHITIPINEKNIVMATSTQ